MRRWCWVFVLLGAAGCSDSGGGSETAAESGETVASGESESDSESGAREDLPGDLPSDPSSDLPTEEPRPELRSPAEAEDLDPDPDVVRVALTAAPLAYEIGGELVEGWAYNGQIPGPTIRVERGDTLTVEFHNGLDSATTIHWHGLHVPFAMDGVTWQGQAVGPGEDFEYSFEIDQAGTYWYHPHVDTDRQVDLGLYGVIVAEDPADPVPDRELVVVFDSWDEFSFDSDDESDHHGLDGTVIEWTANGLIDPVFPAAAGERIRVRAVNVANAGYMALSWPLLRHIGGDQGLLAELSEPESVVLAPSDRMDGEWLIGAGFDVIGLPYSLLGAPAVADERRLFEVQVDAPGAAPVGLELPFDGAEPTPDPGWTDVLYVFHGDPHTGYWTINGELFPDITIESLPLGEWAIVELRNVSQSAHPFHLHGHGFEILSVDGVAPEFRRLEDTFDVAPYSIVRIGVLADNPGDWMAHCHILPHVDGGMMTVLRVE
ncbi:multicopper oxidase family protein [Enhygromyxa salina]|uniref:Multicopper oxidase mco n=1 Tax=Enhygromyxa salina TaxID=215803 RepID=A0A2S9XL97_9BACT|nr:multicopper oxidase family protein [Enhygromyxa salina]PRP93658.1 Multicopper oxidase mco [Enhygromyxa salina]